VQYIANDLINFKILKVNFELTYLKRDYFFQDSVVKQ